MADLMEMTQVKEYPISVGVDLDEVYTSERRRILIVEDDIDTTMLLKHILRQAGFDVFSAENGKEALKKYVQTPPDLVLLDLMMPEMDGWEVLSHLRSSSNTPVMVISALSNKETIVNMLEQGVDDYLTKPFFIDEVVARINAVLRRAKRVHDSSRLTFPKVELTIDLKTKEVTYRGQNVQLTSREFSVLAVLAKNAPALVRYETISQSVWGKDSQKTRQRIKYLVYLLRRKFDRIYPEFELLTNVGRQGYKLQTEG